VYILYTEAEWQGQVGDLGNHSYFNSDHFCSVLSAFVAEKVYGQPIQASSKQG